MSDWVLWVLVAFAVIEPWGVRSKLKRTCARHGIDPKTLPGKSIFDPKER